MLKQRSYRLALIWLISAAFNVSVYSQQLLFKVGDNIIDYLNQNPTQYLTQGTLLMDSPDGQVDFLKYKANTIETDTKYLVQGSNVFGVMQNDNISTYFLYDINGDGILDCEHDFLFLPFWVLSESGYTKTVVDNNLLEYLDNGYKMFNGKENPYSSGSMRKYLTDFASNTGIANYNRDLFYAILEYYSFAQYPELALMILFEFETRYKERFGSSHPVIILHIIESMINNGYRENAADFIKEYESKYFDFIPLKVYSWQLEKNPLIKQQKYEKLKQEHPEHWIVLQI